MKSKKKKTKSQHLGVSCSADLMEKLNILSKFEYRSSSKSHTIRMLIEDKYFDYIAREQIKEREENKNLTEEEILEKDFQRLENEGGISN